MIPVQTYPLATLPSSSPAGTFDIIMALYLPSTLVGYQVGALFNSVLLTGVGVTPSV